MKTNLFLTAAIVIAGSIVSARAEPGDDVKNAIKKLTEKGSYSWTSTSKRPESTSGTNSRWRSGPTNGKTADGFVYLSRTRGERTSETLISGKKVAVKRDDAWTVLEERASGDAGAQGGQRRGRGGAGMYRNFKAPAAQAAELLEKVAELKKDGDAYTGALTEEGAQSLVSFGGRRRGGDDGAERPKPTGVKASAKFWIKDGVLIKYESSVEGKITFNGNERDLSRTSTIEIKDLGSTKIDVPAETRKLLSADKPAA